MTYHEYELVQKCISGDREAFRPLVEAYQQTLFTTIIRMVHDPETARDITQEAFVKAYTKLNTFDTRYPFRIWLTKIAVNTAIDFLRKFKPQNISIDAPVDADESQELKLQLPDPKMSPQETIEQAETSSLVRKAVMELDPKLKAVIVLRHFEEMDYEQIAEILRIPLGSVKNRLFRAREKLHQVLSSRFDVCKEVQK